MIAVRYLENLYVGQDEVLLEGAEVRVFLPLLRRHLTLYDWNVIKPGRYVACNFGNPHTMYGIVQSLSLSTDADSALRWESTAVVSVEGKWEDITCRISDLHPTSTVRGTVKLAGDGPELRDCRILRWHHAVSQVTIQVRLGRTLVNQRVEARDVIQMDMNPHVTSQAIAVPLYQPPIPEMVVRCQNCSTIYYRGPVVAEVQIDALHLCGSVNGGDYVSVTMSTQQKKEVPYVDPTEALDL